MTHPTLSGQTIPPHELVGRKDGKTRAVSKILVLMDDFMHTIWKTYAGSDRIRNKLHADLRTKGLSPPPPPVQPYRRE